MDEQLKQRFMVNLGAFDRQRAQTEGLKHAAVAIAVVDEPDGQPTFILTRRAAKLNSHARQWALPGGRLDPDEDPIEAAIREMEEEIGLRLSKADVMGELDDYKTRSGYMITPVVFWAGSNPTLSPNPDEVAELYRIPLSELDRPDSPKFITIPESENPVIRIFINEYQVHAPTAAVLFQFREVAMHGRPTRVAHFEQPVFAWR